MTGAAEATAAESASVAAVAAPGLSSGRKIAALITVCASLMVITIDVTILNVALPTLADALRADNRALQWFINAYELVFAGLLLTAGALADRFGRRRVLAIGLAVFAAASATSALAGSPGELIAGRVVMGLGGAMVLPATLSIVTNVFTEPSERARAIAVWAGVAALGLGLGPLVGGYLLRHFYWGSVFLVNVPLVIGALAAGRRTIPESRDPVAARLDPIGAVLSIAGLGALLYGVTEGPERGWTNSFTVASFAVAVSGLLAFVTWERRVDDPMLDIGFFRDRRFSAAVVAIMSLFFGMFGLMFVSTQTLQSVLGYDTLGAGVRLVPLPAMFVVFAQISVRLASRFGARPVVATGLVVAALGLAVGASFGSGSGYGVLALSLTLTGIGMGCTVPPAVESIMGTVPPNRAGVASAVNDTTRLTAGAIGVAVVGSVLSSGYRGAVTSSATADSLPPDHVDQAQGSIANAIAVADRIGGAAGDRLLAVARQGFVDGASTGLLIAAVVAAVGAVVAWTFLPATGNDTRGAGTSGASETDGPPRRDAHRGPNETALELRPIGWVESVLVDPRTAPRQGNEGAPEAWINIGPHALPGLRDLEAGTDVLVLTWLDRARRDVLAVRPGGEPANSQVGVFSTRSPDRPNPIGLHRVRILAIEDDKLHVRPLEALDGTPVVDIKPVLDHPSPACAECDCPDG